MNIEQLKEDGYTHFIECWRGVSPESIYNYEDPTEIEFINDQLNDTKKLLQLYIVCVFLIKQKNKK